MVATGYFCQCGAQSCPTVTLWTVACQAALPMEFSRQEYWSGLPFPPPENVPHPGIEPQSPTLAGRLFTTEQPGMPIFLLVLLPLFFFPLLVLIWVQSLTPHWKVMFELGRIIVMLSYRGQTLCRFFHEPDLNFMALIKEKDRKT